MKYTLKQLEALPTLAVGQADDLKVEEENKRIWLSRCTVEDGEPYNNKVSIEQYKSDMGRWILIETYQAV
jgi:hypothetical protein